MNQEICIRKQWFIKSREGKIEDFYSFEQELSSGSFGRVFKAKSKVMKNDPLRAIKMIPKRMIENKEKFMQEVEIMRTLDHPNIIKLYETFEDLGNIYLILELCTGGELFEQIVQQGHLNENDAQQIFIQIMKAITYCHSQGIAHRDLKPENFLYYDDKPDSILKVIDFGLSRVFRQQGQKQMMKSRAGTPYYISPEVLEGKYDELCDVWSAGVILYIMLTGIPPFNGESDGQIVKGIKSMKFRLDIPELESVSEEAKDLLSKMIVKQQNRLSASEVLQHPWLRETKVQGIKLRLNIDSLKQFTKQRKLKKIMLAQIASQVSWKEVSELGKLFTNLDKDGNGQLSFEEFKSGFQEKGIDLMKYFSQIDTDSSGYIDYNEFITAMLERTIYLKQDRLLQAFQAFDLDHDGKITAQELKKVLGNSNEGNIYEQLIKEVDQNGDGQIDYLEFVEMMDSE